MINLNCNIEIMKIRKHLFEKSGGLAHLEEPVKQAIQIIVDSFRKEGKVMICGNGGSSADGDHIAGELMKAFEISRPLNQSVRENLINNYGERGEMLAASLQQGLPAVSLSANSALITAISNDLGGDYIFAQQVAGYGKQGDVLLAISTSGNSQNVVDAILTAKAIGMFVVGLTGEGGGEMKNLCDVLIHVPADKTAEIQEYHLPVYHYMCRSIEMELFGMKNQNEGSV